MKKYGLTYILFLLALASGCGNAIKNAGDVKDVDTTGVVTDKDTPDASTTFKTVTYRDSLRLRPENTVDVRIEYNYPQSGSKPLKDGINAWIRSLYEDYGVTKDTGMDMVAMKAGKTIFASDAAELKALLSDNGDGARFASYAFDSKIEMIYEDATYVTMENTSYRYMGGAHGYTSTEGVTFRKSDGKKMGWELTKGMTTPELRKAIVKGLKEYFEVKSDAELCDCLLSFDASEVTPSYLKKIPLPAMAPCLTTKGIRLTYSAYEIAPYAAGEPTVYIARE